VDQAPLTPTEFSSVVTAITSAFGDPTRREIYLYAREHDGAVTASEVARHFDLHPNVARHHLDKLAGGGYIEVEVARTEGAGAGRPSKRYLVTEQAAGIEFAVRHDDLLISLLSGALALIPRAQAEEMAERVGVEFGRVMAASMGDGRPTLDGGAAGPQRSFRAALHAVADALTAHGFAAHAEKHDNGLRIVSEHCPFGGAAIENPVICAVDRGMVKGMLASLYGDTSPELSSSIPMGDAVCVTAVDA
jgi:predicted ArsR family transcriptional regulator